MQKLLRMSGSKRAAERERTKTATYKVRTLLIRDKHLQDRGEELRETRLVWNVIGITEVRRREECFTTIQSGHLLCHSKENNGQAGEDLLIDRKYKDSEGKQHQP